MNGALRKKVTQRFTAGIKEIVVGAHENSSADLPRGFRCFKLPLLSEVSSYVVLVTASQYDEFTLDVAWSIHHRFPINISAIYNPVDRDTGLRRDAPINGDFAFRLPFLYPPYIDAWWSVGKNTSRSMTVEEILADNPFASPPKIGVAELSGADTVVDQALNAFQKFALPYLWSLRESYPETFRSLDEKSE